MGGFRLHSRKQSLERHRSTFVEAFVGMPNWFAGTNQLI